MADLAERSSLVLGLKADVSRAHRRVRVAGQDHKHQFCRLTDHQDDDVRANEVGTFGIGSASFWWARLFACLLRLTLYVSQLAGLATGICR